jgi:hypothetical protein
MSIPLNHPILKNSPKRFRKDGISHYGGNAEVTKNPDFTWCREHPGVSYNFKRFKTCYRCFAEQESENL